MGARSVWLLVLSLVLIAAGCGGQSPPFAEGAGDTDTDTDSDTDADSDGDTDTIPPSASVEAGAGLLVAADPRLEGFDGWPLLFDVVSSGYDGLSCHLVISRDEAVLIELDAPVEDGGCNLYWDGADEYGDLAPRGALDVRVEVMADGYDDPVADTEVTIEVVRIGFEEIALRGNTGGARVNLLWPETDGELEGYWVQAADEAPWRLGPDTATEPGGSVLDLADGTARPLPEPWTDVKSPPLDDASPDGVEQDSFNLPTAWMAGSEVIAEPTFTTSGIHDPYGADPTVAEIRLVPPEGTSLVDGDGFSNGGSAAVISDGSPVGSVDRFEWTLEWRFEARRAGEGDWLPIPGSITTTHALYGLVDEPTMGSSQIPHRAWVDVVDAVAGWVDSATSDPTEVAGILVQHVFDDMGLVYDDQSGACTYTEYPGWGFGGCLFDMAAFQRRSYGDVINCSDAAAILSTYANMVGVDLNYHILENGQPWQTGFDLNYIVPIGFTEFDETPFASGGGSFSYHAVVGPASGDNIFDATLLLDGDGVPTSPPHTVLYPDDLTEEDYLFALSSEWSIIDVGYDEKVVLQSLNKEVLSDPAGAPTAIVYSRRFDSGAAAMDGLLAWREKLAGRSAEIRGIGDRAYGGRSAVGFVTGDVLTVVRSVDPSTDAARLAAERGL